MAENGRMKYLLAVAKAFNIVMAISRGEIECTVTTAMAVDDSTRRAIEESLQGFVKGLVQSLYKLIIESLFNSSICLSFELISIIN